MRAPVSRALVLLLTALPAGGCVEGLDLVWEVEDARVLGIRAEPPEVMLSFDVDPATGAPRLDAEGLPVLVPSSDMVTFEALLVDPRARPLEVTWRFCPVVTFTACTDFERKRDRAPEELRDALDAMAEPEPAVELPPPPATEAEAVPPYPVPPLTVSITPELVEYHVRDSFVGGGFGTWPSVVLTVDDGERQLTVMKRFVLSVDPVTLRALAGLAEAAGKTENPFGITVCPPDRTPDDVPGCLELAPRPPNSNPTFANVELSWGASRGRDVVEWIDVPHRAQVYPYEELRILPTFTEASEERYQLLRANLDTRKIFIDEGQEEISVSWFASSGELRDGFTWRQFTKTLDTVYRAPGELPELTGNIATVWMVARDQRGGQTWTSIELEVVPPDIERWPDAADRVKDEE